MYVVIFILGFVSSEKTTVAVCIFSNDTTTTAAAAAAAAAADELKGEFRRILVFSASPLCLSLPVVQRLSSVTIPGSWVDVCYDER